MHASTRERLPILNQFYKETLATFNEIDSLLDVACGLNPLAVAWLPITSSTKITVCDIYTDQMDFLNAFFDHFQLNGKAFCCDITQQLPQENYQLGLILKTIPCLEQLDKNIGKRIIHELNCENLLVSFPAQSLSGRNKGMREFYSVHFQSFLNESDWKATTFSYPNEQVFLLKK
jgi:16S rRNA (guanine(1405)-N(7))-methyltransferase